MSGTQVTPSDSPKCPQCGTPLPAGALAGLCPACLLKQGAADDTATGGQSPPFQPPPLAELAAKFPQLEILELIGKGGMGAVYKARQKELDRIVALKILPPGIGQDAAFAGRFAREAKALAKLNHPGIVTLYEFGQVGSRRGNEAETSNPAATPPSHVGGYEIYYFLMEFVDGVNLRQLLHAGRIAPREALAIVPQICDALQYAHDQGIVHRDIKPENILLDRRGRVKVADFGLAKLVGAESGRAGSPLPAAGAQEDDGAHGVTRPTDALTVAGKVMGTPNYMAPEQKEHPDAVDHRADIYALGVVFYQMLTGELPGKRIEPPSRKVEVDVRLDEIVLRALERKPELRYQQASVLKTQVETIAQTPAQSSSAKPEIQGSRWLVGTLPTTPFRKAFGWIYIIFFAGYFLLLVNDHLTGSVNGMVWRCFGYGFIGFAVVGGVELLFRIGRARKAKTPEMSRAIKALLKPMLIGGSIALLLGVYVGVLHTYQSRPLKSDYTGQSWFPAGDSIEITSVERSTNRMVVKGHYNLVSHEEATLEFHITTSTDIRVPEDSKNRVQISKGHGDFELVHSHLVPGLPHVSMYAGGRPFAALYFGTQAEALEESKAKWIAETHQSSSEAMEFGPVIERTIDQMDTGTNFLLDLDTGKMFSLPSELKTNSNVINAENWYARNGIDVSGGATHGWPCPMGLNLIIDPVPRDYWDELTQSNLNIFLRRHADNYAFPGEAIGGTTGTDVHQPTYLFKTREGGMGLLQITGFTDNPRGAKIRYKLVHHAQTTPLVFPVPAQNFSFGPVEERFLRANSFDSPTWWLDLDSGSISELPAGTFYRKWTKRPKLGALIVDNKIHLAVPGQMFFSVVPGLRWDTASPNEVRYIVPVPVGQQDDRISEDMNNETTSLITGITTNEPFNFDLVTQGLSVTEHLDDVVTFKTVKGNLGLLQITAFTENPPGVKIRYKLVQNAAAQPDDGLESKAFTAQFSHGQIGLLGVSRLARSNSTWWRPDGSISSQSFEAEWNHSPASDSIARLVFETRGFPNHSAFSYKVVPAACSTIGQSSEVRSGGKQLPGCDMLFVKIPKPNATNALKQFTVQIGVASGPGTVISTCGPQGGSGEGASLPDGTRILLMSTSPIEGKDFISLTYSYSSLPGWNAIISAVDNDGKIQEAVSSEASVNELATTEVRFDGLKLSDVKEFRFAVRRYEWMEFNNISLLPGHRTDVEVRNVVEEPKQDKLVQNGDALEKTANSLPLTNAIAADEKNDPEAATLPAIQTWLGLMDSGQYAESWRLASEGFRALVTEDEWVSKGESIRKPLGKLLFRKVEKTEPNGQYLIAKFDSSFEGLKAASETVTFAMESNGQRRAAGYLILPRSNTNSAAVEPAQAWLRSIDAGNYAPSWTNAAALFQQAITPEKWMESMQAFRQPLGSLISRKVISAQEMASLPGAPDGRYIVMQFETSFTNKKSAVETVTFMLEKDGQWKAAGYYIK